MDLETNKLVFSGTSEWHKAYKAGNKPWGSIKIRVGLPKFDFEFQGNTQRIDKPIILVTIPTTYVDSKLEPRFIDFLNRIETHPYLIFTNAKLSNYESVKKDSNGDPIQGAPIETIYTVETSVKNIYLRDTPVPIVNTFEGIGYVEKHDPSGYFITKVPYKGKDSVKYRKFYSIIDPEESLGNLEGSKIYCAGSVCGKTPKRDSKTYVVAKQVIKLK